VRAGRATKPLLCVTLLALACAAPAAAASTLHVIPFPGTPAASPLSDVIFSSLHPSELRSVTATGSASGLHTGHSMALPDGAGTAFVPAQPFTAGERVQVTAVLSSPAAGTASGEPGATTLQFSFTIATPARPPATRSTASSRRSARAAGSSPTQSFHSAPGLHPPVIQATSDPDSSSGEIFLTETTPPPRSEIQNGLMILDGRARLLWFKPLNGFATNLEVQRYHGRPVLTWFQQAPPQGNEDVVMSSSYRTVATLHAGDGYRPDMHEFQLTPQGTALIDAYTPVTADMSSIGGPSSGAVWDCIVQELDVRTGRVLWEWHSLGHVPLSATYNLGRKGWPPYEYFHLNSIQQLPNGNLLISARNTWAVYEIDKQTGRVIWTLGGKDSSFKIGPGANFEWQHDARLTGDTLSLFDDGALPQEERQSSAKVLRLNTTTMTASLVRRYTHSPPVLTGVEGSTQLLPNRNVFVGWGKQPLFSEYTAAGKQIFAASLPLGTNSYRAFRFPWTGRPATRPSFNLPSSSAKNLRVYASWNGATRVASWRVRGGSGPGAMRALASARRSGFETTILVPGHPRYLSVQALDAQGKVIGTSRLQKG
jgi:hypothetical protein